MDLLAEIPFDIPINKIILQEGIAQKANSVVEGCSNALLVCDENTNGFIRLPCQRLVLPARQKPTLQKAQEISKNGAAFFIAVGSGSLNDIVKYAAFLAGRPYIVFPTALSMNGYASANVSLFEENNLKKSFLGHPPREIYMDMEILKNAPASLNASGVGDSACIGVNEFDVELSHQVVGTPLYPELFQLIKKYGDDIFDDVTALAKTLIFSGLAMLIAKSSGPASQGEHMLAHYMELMDERAPHSYHGQQIAVTSVTSARHQRLLLENLDEVNIPPLDEAAITRHFGSRAAYFITQAMAKYRSLEGKKIRLDKKRLERLVVNEDALAKKLKHAGAPTSAAEIGWDETVYDNAVHFTRFTRDRFTWLDLF